MSGGTVVSTWDFQLEGWRFKPGFCPSVVTLDKNLCITLSVSTQVYKWVPAT